MNEFSAKAIREKRTAKARSLAEGNTDGRVDASDFTPAEPLNTEKKVGPVRPKARAYKQGGKVQGKEAPKRADRKPRTAGRTNEKREPRRAGGGFDFGDMGDVVQKGRDLVSAAGRKIGDLGSKAGKEIVSYMPEMSLPEIEAAAPSIGERALGPAGVAAAVMKPSSTNDGEDAYLDRFRRMSSDDQRRALGMDAVPAPDAGGMVDDGGFGDGAAPAPVARSRAVPIVTVMAHQPADDTPTPPMPPARSARPMPVPPAPPQADGPSLSNLSADDLMDYYNAPGRADATIAAEGHRKGGRVGRDSGGSATDRSQPSKGGITPDNAGNYTNSQLRGMNSEGPSTAAHRKGGRVGRMMGGPLAGPQNPVPTRSMDMNNHNIGAGGQPGLFQRGGRTARKDGGRAKGKTNINIIIGGKPGGEDHPQQPPQMPPFPPPPPAQGVPVAAPPPMAPPGGAPGAPGGMPAPGGPPRPGMPPSPMMRKSGGRTTYPIDNGAGGGKGRLEKIKAYGLD